MMDSERLATVLYSAWLESDRDDHRYSAFRLPPWLGLTPEERTRWREVAEAGLRLTATLEEYHGKVIR